MFQIIWVPEYARRMRTTCAAVMSLLWLAQTANKFRTPGHRPFSREYSSEIISAIPIIKNYYNVADGI